jgi:hypothetical protein
VVPVSFPAKAKPRSGRQLLLSQSLHFVGSLSAIHRFLGSSFTSQKIPR